MNNGTMTLIQSVTVGAGGQGGISFTAIPNTYDDLFIRLSHRATTNTDVAMYIQFNGSSSNLTGQYLFGEGSNTRGAGTLAGYIGTHAGNAAQRWCNTEVYISDYKSSNNKTFSSHNVTEQASSITYMNFTQGVWANSAVISSIDISAGVSFGEYTIANLYGITRIPTGAKATGGMITSDSQYIYHTFVSSDVFTPTQSINADILVIAGGGAGASGGNSAGAGGGGAGGLLLFSNQALSVTNYTCTVGAGGASVSSSGTGVNGNVGNDSQFGALTLVKGGGFGGAGLLDGVGTNGGNGGSGGGAGRWSNSASFNGGSPTSGQGFRGGNALSTGAGGRCAGGGGGAGAQGTDTTNVGTANGGAGLNTYSAWASATLTGSNGFYAGGGAGSAIGQGPTTGGAGGGGSVPMPTSGAQIADSGLANTGGGGAGMGGGDQGGPAKTSGSGGSGIIIVRYAK